MSPDWLDLLSFYSMLALEIAAVVAAFAVIVAAVFFLVYRLPLAFVPRRFIQCPRCDGNLISEGPMAEIDDEQVPQS